MKTAAVSLSALMCLSIAGASFAAHNESLNVTVLRDGAQNQNQPSQDQEKPKIFSGRIVSLNGELFILRDDTNGIWYHLDDQKTAGKFAGKNVDVTGILDAKTNVLHVQSIEEQKS